MAGEITDDEASLDALLLRNPMKGNLGEIKIVVDRATRLVCKKIRKGKSSSEEHDGNEEDEDDGIDNIEKNVRRDNGKNPSGETIPEVRKVLESSKKATTIKHQVQ